MSPSRPITNQDHKDHVQAHPLTARLRGEICHVTTSSNALSILDDGRIRVDTSRNGIHPCYDDAPPSACRAIGAVSVFDFAAPDDQLFWVQRLGPDLYEYVMHWWSLLTRHPHTVIFLLDDAVRTRFDPDPERGQIRQFIAGTECCHVGDIDAHHFSGFLLTSESGDAVTAFAPDEVDRLRQEIHTLLAPSPPEPPDLDPATEEARRRIAQLISKARQTPPGSA